MAKEQKLSDFVPERKGIGGWIADNHAKQPSLGSELKAIVREGIKDVRGTLHQVAWGQPEGASEIGTPLNPTQVELTNDREVIEGYDAMLAEAAGRGHQEHDRGR